MVDRNSRSLSTCASANACFSRANRASSETPGATSGVPVNLVSTPRGTVARHCLIPAQIESCISQFHRFAKDQPPSEPCQSGSPPDEIGVSVQISFHMFTICCSRARYWSCCSAPSAQAGEQLVRRRQDYPCGPGGTEIDLKAPPNDKFQRLPRKGNGTSPPAFPLPPLASCQERQRIPLGALEGCLNSAVELVA